MNELALRHAIQQAVSALGARLFRVNTGQAWAGEATQMGTGIFLRKPYRMHMGLTTGGSDLIGWTPVTITADMVGSRVAVFTAVELKAGRTRTTEEQENFLAQVTMAGGLAGVARSVEHAVAIVTAAPPARI